MTTLTVGSGQQFSTIAGAVAASQDGDVVQVQAGTYVNDFAEVSKKITIEGVGGMAKLVATSQVPNGKAILITDTDVTLDHLDFSGASVADGNGAGVRYQGGNLTITNSSFHDNQDGLLAADMPSGSISISGSEFYHNGTGNGLTHNLYVGDVGQLTITNSYFHSALVGHEIKSRAENTTITGSRIQDEPGSTASYEIDLPNGGNAVIANNVIEQSAATQNPIIISYGEEGTLRANSALSVANNTILNDRVGTATAVNNATTLAASISNNQVWNLTAAQVLAGPGTVSGTTTLSSEPALVTTSPIAAGASTGSAATASAATTYSATESSTAVSGTTASATTASSTTVANSTSGLVLDISEDAWQGDALYTVSVDGQLVGGTRTATASHAAGQTEAVSIGTTLTAGSHQVGVTFLNDAYGGTPTTDRNLYVDGATLNGQSQLNAVLPLLSSGTATFGVTQPGGSTGSASTSASSTSASTSTSGATSSGTTAGLVLNMSEDAWQGDAQFSVAIDGQAVGTYTATASHAAGSSQAFALGALSAGSHTVAVSFLNDAYGGTPTTDRNLYIDGATLDGSSLLKSPIPMVSNGTVSFAAVAGSGSAATTTTSSSTTAPSSASTSTAASGALVLNVSEDAWQGDAKFIVTVDHQQVGGIYTATASHAAGQTQAITIGTLSAGSHSVGVTFINDAYGGTASTDRNLYLDSATLNGQVVPGSTASLPSNGTATFAVGQPASGATTTPTSSGSGGLVLNVSEDAWNGDAAFTVAIDGTAIGSYTATASHASGGTQAILLAASLSAGTHKVAVTFTNDAYGGTPTTDRNLYIDSATYNGQTVPGSTIPMPSAGTSTFNVVVPAA